MGQVSRTTTYARVQELIKGGMEEGKAWTQAFLEGGENAEADTKAKAEAATKSVWSSIADGLKEIIPVAGSVYIKRKEMEMAERLARAQGRVTGGTFPTTPTQVMDTHPIDYSPPTPLWKSPFVWVGGALVLGGAAFLMLRRRSPARRRSNASGSMKYRRRAA